jgi:hypothetical protein
MASPVSPFSSRLAKDWLGRDRGQQDVVPFTIEATKENNREGIENEKATYTESKESH